MSIFSRMGPLSRKQVAAKTHIKLNSWRRVQNKTHGLDTSAFRDPLRSQEALEALFVSSRWLWHLYQGHFAKEPRDMSSSCRAEDDLSALATSHQPSASVVLNM